MSRLPSGLPVLDAIAARLILRTSQGFPQQWSPAKQTALLRGKPTPSGHQISRHVQGAKGMQTPSERAAREKLSIETKFRSVDDAAENLAAVAAMPQAKATLSALKPTKRAVLSENLPPSVSIEVRLNPKDKLASTHLISASQIRTAGVTSVPYLWIVEHRQRAENSYLHVVSGYPNLTIQQVEKLAKTIADSQ